MCGLVGIAGDCTGPWKDVFSTLLLYDVVRGPHSTGVGFVGRFDNKFTLVKRVGHPFNVFESKAFDDAMGINVPMKVMMGHNRFATVGDKTEANAHPFQFQHVMGAHNGTLDKWALRDLPGAAQFSTDSEAIFARINATSVKETIPLVTGAWALTWYDKRKNTLNFLRNDRRPLHYAYSEDRCTLIWASEIEMLKYVLQRFNRRVFQSDTKEDQFYQPEKDKLYSWELPKHITGKFEPPDQEEISGKVYASSGYSLINSFGGSYYSSDYIGSMQKGLTDPSSNVVSFAERPATNRFRPPYKDIYGHIINKKDMLAMVADGCAFCNSDKARWGDFIHVMGHYSGKNTPFMCEACFNNGETYEYAQYAI